MAVPDIFQLLSDPTRRRLLELLRDRERSVNELVDGARMSQPAVSKQLRVLKDSGLVTLRKEGRVHLYSIRGEPFREASRWIGYYKHFWEEGLARMDELLGPDAPPKGRRKA